ncbi:MAG: transposase [Eubacterium sp.]|nr:transposase [Eubacterium sp.]
MPRRKRIWYPGAIYHVLSRGNRRAPIFMDERDYRQFLRYLQKAQAEMHFEIHTLCLMTNHFHMLVRTGDVDLSDIMQFVLYKYARYFNRRHGYTGHLFERRFTSFNIEDDLYYREVSRYIHLNPVKAGIVDDPIDYAYSSYWMFVDDNRNSGDAEKAGGNKIDKMIEKLVDPRMVLQQFNNNKNRYKGFVQSRISHKDHEIKIQKDINEDAIEN